MLSISNQAINMCLWSDTSRESPLASAESLDTGRAALNFTAIAGAISLKISKTGRMNAELTFSTLLSDGLPNAVEVILPSAEELDFLAPQFFAENPKRCVKLKNKPLVSRHRKRIIVQLRGNAIV